MPDLLELLNCDNNKLTYLPELPNSLRTLYCDNNQLITFPDISHIDHKLKLTFIQDLPIDYISYNTKLELSDYSDNKINIVDYPYNPITNQEELNKYMEFIKNYKMNKIKSARK